MTKHVQKWIKFFSHGADGTTILTYKALSRESLIHRIMRNNKDMKIVSESVLSNVSVAW